MNMNEISYTALEWYDTALADDELTRDNFHLFILGFAEELEKTILTIKEGNIHDATD